VRGGINTPPYPFIYFSLAYFETEQASKQKRALSLPLFHSWVIFLGESSEIVARAKIRARKLSFHLLSIKPLAGGFKFITLRASSS
jgi:hypothetical protein